MPDSLSWSIFDPPKIIWAMPNPARLDPTLPPMRAPAPVNNAPDPNADLLALFNGRFIFSHLLI
jgi:hypothetical protein